MQIIHRCCCGLDVHKKLIVACLISLNEAGEFQKEIRSFPTMTKDILALADWLTSAGCTHVAMESTGVYWRPIWNLLEGQFELLLVNAQHIKAVPGRKTDIKDAEWIADLLQHGLLRASFVPPAPQRHLRELTRYRSTLLAERARLVNRLHKVLEDTNLKLTAVVTNIMGLSARDMLDALLQGETNPEVLAKLARGKLRKKREDLEQALVGRVDDHHRFLLTSLLTHIDFLDEQVADCNGKIEQFLSAPSEEKAELVSSASDDQRQEQAPVSSTPVGTESMLAQDRVPEDGPKLPLSYQQAIALLDSIPGVNQRIAEIFIAEVGTDMQRFPTAQNLASWVGICPGNHQSAGKQIRGTTWHPVIAGCVRPSLKLERRAMRTKDTYLSAQGRRLTHRRGKKRAVVAVAHTILIIAYHILQRQHPYQDLGRNYFDERERSAIARQSVRRLEQLGFKVMLETAGEAA
jgi:transposase